MSIFLSFALMVLKGALTAVGSFFAEVYKLFGWGGIICVGLVITEVGTVGYFNGVPLVRKVPFISSLPWVGPIAVGHVQARVNEAVAGARHGFAVEQENAAAKATADAETQSKLQAQKVAAVYKALLTDEQAKADQTSKEYTDALLRAARARKAAGLRCDPLDAGTAAILRKHGFKIAQ